MGWKTLLNVLLLSAAATGCMRARLLNPPTALGPQNLVTTTGALLSPTGGTLHGSGVTLQATLGLATPTQLTGTGVSLKIGP